MKSFATSQTLKTVLSNCDAKRDHNYRLGGDSFTITTAEYAALRDAVLSETKVRIPVPLVVRPMLTKGMLATDAAGPVILIDCEQDPKEQVVTLFHEVLHLLGMTDEFLCDEYAMRLADAAPDVLRRLAHNINLPPYDRNAASEPLCAAPTETKERT